MHCYWGLGRTGTMLACYLVKLCGMDAQSAITQVRYTRPYSIETYEQEEAVFDYAEYLSKKFPTPNTPSGTVDTGASKECSEEGQSISNT